MDGQASDTWSRTAEGKVALRLVEAWEAGLTDGGDIALCFTSILGNDPKVPSGQPHRSQFICNAQDARQIAYMILRTVTFAQSGQREFLAEFRTRIRSRTLLAVFDEWNHGRKQQRMPNWTDIRHAALGPHLGRLWGFDYEQRTGQFTGRFGGRNSILAFRRSLGGIPLADLHPPEFLKVAQANFTRVVIEPSCLRVDGKLFKMDDQIVEGERLILPISDDGEHAVGLLGVSDFDAVVAHPPYKFEMIHDKSDWCHI